MAQGLRRNAHRPGHNLRNPEPVDVPEEDMRASTRRDRWLGIEPSVADATEATEDAKRRRCTQDGAG